MMGRTGRLRWVVWIGLMGGLGVAKPGWRAVAGSDGSAKYAPTSQYETRKVGDWTVLINKTLLKKEPEMTARALELLRFQLYQVERAVPPAAVKQLKKVRFWMEEQSLDPCMVYHPNPQWLREHGLNPDKGGCVEIANVRNFLDWTLDQPWMVLHELAHAYHDQVLKGGHHNAEVRAVYERAMTAKRYEQVLHFDGVTRRAYAANNPQEYFAEASEAFFGTNDFYPFVRSELRKHDPDGFDLVRRLWKAPAQRPRG